MGKTERILALADCNNFFVSCEILKNPSLKGKAVCVLSNCDGCVVSRSQEAKQLGIRMGMPLFMAKQEFPNAIYLSGDMKTYHAISKRVRGVLNNFAPDVEVCSIDEAFIDVTDLYKLYGLNGYEELAEYLHKKILDEVGVPVSVGVANSKILCKVATDKAKKGTFHYYLPKKSIGEEVEEYPIEKIWGVGKNTVSLLKSHGIYTAGDILRKDKEFFSNYMGKRGLELKLGIEGENVSPVCSEEQKPKSIQRTSSFKTVTNEKEFLKNAHEGFVAAFSKEDFPMCGMDQYTMMYLLAELARRIGKNDEAKRYVSKVLVARNAQRRIKDKAFALKEKLQGKAE